MHSPNNSKEEALKVVDFTSLWIEILHYTFEHIEGDSGAYPCSLRLDGQPHLLPPLSTIVLCELILLALHTRHKTQASW